MIKNRSLFLSLLILLTVIGQAQEKDARFTSFTTESSTITLFWKDTNGKNFSSLQNLKNSIEASGKQLRFAMNGGMYLRDGSPQGLFIENGTEHKKLDTASSGFGNFYLKPNGVFYITTDNKAVVCQTSAFTNTDQIKFATQSGPMLLTDGEVHTAFKKGSANLNIRNGVGILPDGRVVFAISKTEVNLYDFAMFFKNLGCKNALYLDGFVSRMYLPEENWQQLDGNFGVLIGVVK